MFKESPEQKKVSSVNKGPRDLSEAFEKKSVVRKKVVKKVVNRADI